VVSYWGFSTDLGFNKRRCGGICTKGRNRQLLRSLVLLVRLLLRRSVDEIEGRYEELFGCRAAEELARGRIKASKKGEGISTSERIKLSQSNLEAQLFSMLAVRIHNEVEEVRVGQNRDT